MYNIDQCIKGFFHDGIPFYKINLSSEIVKIIDEKNRTFLELYGLPNLNKHFIIEDLEFFDYIKIEIINNNYYIIIGRDSMGSICIDIPTGEIISIDMESNYKKYFINSSLSDFFICLYLYNRFCINNKTELDEKEQLKLYNLMQNLFNQVNSNILDSESNWWNEIIEPLEYGMF